MIFIIRQNVLPAHRGIIIIVLFKLIEKEKKWISVKLQVCWGCLSRVPGWVDGPQSQRTKASLCQRVTPIVQRAKMSPACHMVKHGGQNAALSMTYKT